MKHLLSTAAVLSLLAAPMSAAWAQPGHHDNGRGPGGGRWHQGGRIGHDDWARGRRVDYNRYHLRRPPRGYEWREVDGNYVLAAVATGLIASVVLANQ